MKESSLDIRPGLAIPESELSFRASRSGGPGGQHVNNTSSRVELIWDVGTSPSLDDSQRRRLYAKLGNRITNDGLLILASSATRSQHRNREDAVERFVELLREAMHKPKRRKRTRPTRASREKRLRNKRRRSEKKQLRGKVDPE